MAEIGPNSGTPARSSTISVHRQNDGENGDSRSIFRFLGLVIPFLALIWAEVAGKHKKREWQLERENGEVFSDDLRRFPMNPRVVEG